MKHLREVAYSLFVLSNEVFRCASCKLFEVSNEMALIRIIMSISYIRKLLEISLPNDIQC